MAEQMHVAVASIQDLLASKLALGLMVMLVNVGSRFVFMDVRPAVERALANPWSKRAVVFASIFLTTRDVVVATGCLFLFMLLVEGIASRRPHPPSTAPAAPGGPAHVRTHETAYGGGRQLANQMTGAYRAYIDAVRHAA